MAGTLGDVNGWWVLIIKLVVASHPVLFACVVAWGSWCTMQTVENQYGVNIVHQRIDDHNARASHPGAVTVSELKFVIDRLDRIESKIDAYSNQRN